MTIPEIKELVEQTKDYSEEDMINIAWGLPFFDGCNYVAWMKKLYGVSIPI